MGGGCSKTADAQSVNSKERTLTEHSLAGTNRARRWKLLPNVEEARNYYVNNEGTLPEDGNELALEFRTLLDDFVAVDIISKYSRSKNQLPFLNLWSEIRAAQNGALALDLRISNVELINAKYIQVPPDDFRNLVAIPAAAPEISTLLEKLQVNATTATSTGGGNGLGCSVSEKEALLAAVMEHMRIIQLQVFKVMVNSLFLPFRLSPSYQILGAILKSEYNQVVPDDFDYISKLGNGAFGVVLKCRKRSTGVIYAMKVQHKSSLLENFISEPWRINDEKKAYALCQHPFIIEFAFAFQTETLAMIVMSLCTLGDLRSLLLSQPKERFRNEYVHFYSAEITSVLTYLHRMGLIYRDLKPGNVLLHQSGHIKLVDLGGAVDVSGDTITKSSGLDQSPAFDRISNLSHDVAHSSYVPAGSDPRSPMDDNTNEVDCAAPLHQQSSNLSYSEHSAAKAGTRAKSIVGTVGYMAPEVVVMMNQMECKRHGYSYAVDWWSLGATIYKMYTGARPYSSRSRFYGHHFVEMHDSNAARVEDKIPMLGLEAAPGAAAAAAAEANHQFSSGVKYTEEGEINPPSHQGMHVISIKAEEERKAKAKMSKLRGPQSELFFDSSLFPQEGEDLIRALLDFDPNTRLGSGSQSSFEVMSHPYFANVNWTLLDQLAYTPPPPPVAPGAAPTAALGGNGNAVGMAGSDKPGTKLTPTSAPGVRTDSLPSMLQDLGYKHWLEPPQPGTEPVLAKCFSDWDYVSPAKVVEEMEVARSLEEARARKKAAATTAGNVTKGGGRGSRSVVPTDDSVVMGGKSNDLPHSPSKVPGRSE